MSDFSEGLRILEEAAARRREREGERFTSLLDHGELVGSTFRKGDRVRDAITGEEGNVIESRFENYTLPAAGGEGS